MDMELTGNNETPEELESLIDGLGEVDIVGGDTTKPTAPKQRSVISLRGSAAKAVSMSYLMTCWRLNVQTSSVGLAPISKLPECHYVQ
ncbi:hypothetical protein AB9H26_04195 [Yersinia enterocolitica]|uniref:hypothetical protein n=2 Tax=Yersinia enterocolitica TaxID=630 RepID=UPI0032F47496|nr:hypothetical protein [Yersinia enterocolitica]HDL6876290.1 hypothetical protein [Yersinia enterocolitica]HDL6889155.1 hypothetical protein [Yersinia enterocolitica]HDL6892853.1 hypothetical protein [Yersinia enterocolitica]HDL7911701.1 hypothetical protein [Yersinia enterocolitica]